MLDYSFYFILFLAVILIAAVAYRYGDGERKKSAVVLWRDIERRNFKVLKAIAREVERGTWPGIRVVSGNVPREVLPEVGYVFASMRPDKGTKEVLFAERAIMGHIEKYSREELAPLWAVYLNAERFAELARVFWEAKETLEEMEEEEAARMKIIREIADLTEEEIARRFGRYTDGEDQGSPQGDEGQERPTGLHS
jgi:hypothetical protein